MLAEPLAVATASAADIMKTEIITIGPSEDLREALTLMVDNHISGLPVVDGRGRVLGVLSATDILDLEYEQAESAADDEQVGAYFDPDAQRWENMRFAGGVDELPDRNVSDVISTDLVAVHPDASVVDVANLMVNRGVHRVLVVDDQQKLCGLIAALDVVGMVAAA